MRAIFIFSTFILVINCYSQNIISEISGINKIGDRLYSSYHYANSSYSYSRPLLLLITNRNNFNEIQNKIPLIYASHPKQNYTDIYLLGLENVNNRNISIADSIIIDTFLESILQYRACNNLPKYSTEKILSQSEFIEQESDLCRALLCRTS